MSATAPGEARPPVLRQYFGAIARHPEACIEMSFPLPARRFPLQAFAEPLESKGFEVDPEAFASEYPLPEAIGVLVSAILAKAVQPRWNWGVEEGNAWICLSYPLSPLSAANAMLQCHGLLVGDGSQNAVRQVMRAATTWIAPGKMNGLTLGAAAEMGLEVLTVSTGGLVFQVGAGRRARHLFELSNDGDSFIGQVLAKDKLSSIELLQRANLPTTRAIALWRTEDAPGIAARVGYPCVVKPRDRGKGKGVTARIQSDQALAEAVSHAASLSTFPLLIENHVEGADHRMMVIGGKLLWVYRRDPPFVTGDGVSTIEGLIAAENRRREPAIRSAHLYLIVPDAPMARFVEDRYGLTLRSVPAEGTRIELSAEANVSRGGTLHDVTAHVHPDNVALAVLTTRLFRMNALGLDFMTPDISRSWKELPSAIIEVNGSPGISGRGDASLAMRTLFPGTLSGRIPTFVVVGDERFQRQAGRLLAEALTRRRFIVGRCIYALGAQEQSAGEPFWPVRARRVEALLMNPDVDAIVIMSTAQQIERLGFPVERCDVLITAADGLPAHMTRPAGRVVTGTVDGDSASRLVSEVAEAHDGVRPGGAWPVAELIAGASPGEAAMIRCWRFRVLQRAQFGADLGGSRGGMATQEDIVGMIVGIARRNAQDGLPIELGAVPAVLAWDTPYIDVPVLTSGEHREAALSALAAAVGEVNCLIDRMK